ncbi:MAG: hypothetical protein DHS20C21_12410 [Gemmatimonadota bacterium]|nr:MAG: hypothetical protein DHS20C21_12410 [Gemmatimonadota bacterium]
MALGNPLEFDQWAEDYDACVQGGGGFPFDGYDLVLRRAVALADAGPGDSLLDLGVGTGNLASRFLQLGCQVRGLDFSPEMLRLAAPKLPGVLLGQADILGTWPPEFRGRFDRIVSAYVFHHFDQAEKIELLLRLSREHIAENGSIVVADLAFPGEAALDQARVQWAESWDEEHYWIVDRDLPACQAAGLRIRYEAVGPFAGVFVCSAGPGATEANDSCNPST